MRKLLAATALTLLSVAARSGVIQNLTGLPAYPRLRTAAMDDTYRVEALGRWCARFRGTTTDSLPAVEDWYRRNVRGVSETDLADDRLFRRGDMMYGVKLAVDYDYIALYRASSQLTVVELHRCTWN